jgi:hypothetical protein
VETAVLRLGTNGATTMARAVDSLHAD